MNATYLSQLHDRSDQVYEVQDRGHSVCSWLRQRPRDLLDQSVLRYDRTVQLTTRSVLAINAVH